MLINKRNTHRTDNRLNNVCKMNNLKKLINQDSALLAPGVYDALSALIAEQAGFNAVYLSGASIAYTALGRSDVGLTTATEVGQILGQIRQRVSIPIIVDADTGFGNALNTQRTVKDFERLGANMIQIEDQDFPKRCGHLDGKRVIPVKEMMGKLKAALDARTSVNTLILARTDALAVEGFEAAIERAFAYVECGVDALFIEALKTPAQMQKACNLLSGTIPMLANMVEGGKTPIYSANDLGEMGFRIVIFPGGTVRSVAHNLSKYYSSLHLHQSTQMRKGEMLDFDQLNELIGTPDLMQLGKKYES